MTTPGRRPLVALLAAEILSLTGTRLSMVAIPWLVLTSTGDPLLTGVAAFAEMLPYVLIKALSGPLIDRLGARPIAIAGDAGAMAAIALVPMLQALGWLSMPTLLPAVALLGALRGPADAAKISLVPAVAAEGGVPLERVTGILGTIERLASATGAAIAGGLVALLGAAAALGLTALTFAASGTIVALGLRRVARVAPQSRGERTPYLRDLREGWRFFRGDAVLVGIVVMVATTNLLDQAYSTVLLPVWAEARGSAVLLGLLFATFSAASVFGAALATLLAGRLPRLMIYTVTFLVTGAPRFLVFALPAPMAVTVTLLIAAGFASGFINPIIGAVMFERIPAALTGRVIALVDALCWGLIPFGGLVGGATIAAIGLPAAFALFGFAYLAATMLPLTLRSFRAFAVRPQAAE